MRLNDFLARLKGVKNSGGGQYAALCPAHADKEQSLSISEKDGKILLHCHAGCDKERVLGHKRQPKPGITKQCKKSSQNIPNPLY